MADYYLVSSNRGKESQLVDGVSVEDTMSSLGEKYSFTVHVSPIYREQIDSRAAPNGRNNAEKVEASIGRVEQDFEMARNSDGILARIEKGDDARGTYVMLAILRGEMPIDIVTATLQEDDYVRWLATNVYETLEEFGEAVQRKREYRKFYSGKAHRD